MQETKRAVDTSRGIAPCGLCCFLCDEHPGCKGCLLQGCPSEADCGIRACCLSRGLQGCWQCADFPCGQGLFAQMRIAAFVRFARAYGVDTLTECLARNERRGVRYHHPGLLTGDYDACADERAVFGLLRDGPVEHEAPRDDAS